MSSLSVIVVTNGERLTYLNKCIDSLILQETNGDYEILIIYSGIIEDYKKKTDSKITYIYCPQENYCKKRNVGAKRASKTILAYIDDDAIANQYWVSSAIEYFNNNSVIFAGGRVYPNYETEIPKNILGYEKYIGGFNEDKKIKYSSENIIGCNMFVRKEWLIKVGGFNEWIGELNTLKPRKLMGGDETDLLKKLEENKIGFIKDAIVTHAIQKSRISKEFIIKRSKAIGYGDVILKYKKNYKLYNLLINKIVIICRIFYLILRNPISFKNHLAIYRLIGAFSA